MQKTEDKSGNNENSKIKNKQTNKNAVTTRGFSGA